jgi:hypothetical protein
VNTAPNSTDDDACSLNMFKISNASSFSFLLNHFVAHDYFIYELLFNFCLKRSHQCSDRDMTQ